MLLMIDNYDSFVFNLLSYFEELGIDGVLDQLFEHGGWSLDHFTSGYLIGDAVGEEMYDFAHRKEKRGPCL